MSKKIYKYRLDNVAYIPNGFKVLKVGVQDNNFFMWAEVDPEVTSSGREFLILGTGADAPREPFSHLETLIVGKYVWHIYIKEINDA